MFIFEVASGPIGYAAQGPTSDASHAQSGKAEYKSLTLSLDATAEEFTDFYLDDDIRPTWVNA